MGNALAQSNCGGEGQPACPQLGDASDISGVPIDLLPPGARALGLAGAFGAVADDATAAVANPAGLTILSASEFSIHFRDSDFAIDTLDVDAYNSGLFSTAGELNKKYNDSSSDVSFASFVKPFDRFTLSAYYLNQISIEAATTPESVFDSNFIDTFTNVNALQADVEAFGLGLGFRVNDTISIGLSVQRTELEARSVDQWGVEDFFDLEFLLASASGWTPENGCTGIATACGSPLDFSMELDDFNGFGTLVDGDDNDTTFNAGILINPNGRWSFGLVYRQGGEFDFSPSRTRTTRLGCNGSTGLNAFCLGLVPASTETIDVSPIPSVPGDDTSPPRVTTIEIPDTITFGIAWRPSDTLLISLDVNNIDYSSQQPIRPNTLGFNLDVDDSAFRATMNDPQLNTRTGRITEEIDDGTTIHLGIEKVFPLSGDFLNMYTLTLRGGAFTEEDHDGNALIDSDDTTGVFGIGGTFGDHIQVDLAASFGGQVDNIVLSAIYRF